MTNLQIERVELLNEFDDSDDAKSSSSVAKVGLSGEMAKKIVNKNRILENNDRDKTGAYYNANAPFRYPWGGTSPGTSHSDESSSSSKKGGLTEDVSEQDILRGQHFDADLRGNAMSPRGSQVVRLRFHRAFERERRRERVVEERERYGRLGRFCAQNRAIDGKRRPRRFGRRGHFVVARRRR